MQALIQTALILIPILLNIVGELILKASLNALVLSKDVIEATLSIISSPGALSGIFLILLGSILWLIALSRYQLSYLYPFMALNYVGIILGSSLFLQEKIELKLYLATSLLCIGLFLMSKSQAKENLIDAKIIQNKTKTKQKGQETPKIKTT